MSHILCNEPLKQLNIFSLNETFTKMLVDDKPYDLVLIFPTGKYVRYFKQNFVKQYYSLHKKPLSELKIYTLQGFINLIFDSLGLNTSYKQLSEGYLLALFEEAIEKANLKFYKTKSKKIPNSVLLKLFSLINGLREDGITLNKLQEDYESINKELPEELSYYTDTHRISDIIKIFANFDKLLSGKYIDFPKLLNLTIDKLNEFDDQVFQNKISDIFGTNSTIYLDAFTDFKKPEITFLSFFVKAKNPFGIHIDYSYSPSNQNGNGPLFGNLEEIIIDFHKAGFHLISLSNYPNEQVDNIDYILNYTNEAEKESLFGDISGFLRRWLFNAEKDLKNPNLTKFIKILIAENRKDEVKHIAKLVKYLINIKGYSPSDICICSRQPQLYSGLFREMFARFRIPSNITDRFNLAQSPVINAILSVLEIISGGFKIDDVSKALNSPYLSFEFNEKSDKIDKGNLLDVARKLRIRGGYLFGRENEWISKFENSILYLTSAINQSNNKPDDELELKSLIKRLEAIKKAHDDFNIILNLLKYSTKKLSSSDFQQIIIEIIKKFKILESIEQNYLSILKDNNDKFWKNVLLERCENDSKAINKFLEVLNEMTYVINELTPNLSTSIDFYIEKLKTSITTTKYQISEKQGYGVTITSIEQTRGIPFKVLILCGAVDGEFLLKYTPNQFLGIELPDSEKRHIHSERMLFYQFLTNTPEFFDSNEKLIYITYFKSDDSGEKVRSPFIDALLKISTLKEDGCIIDVSEFNQLENTSLLNSSNDIHDYEWLGSISNYDELYNYFSKSDLTESTIEIADALRQNFEYIRNYLFKSSDANKSNEESGSMILQNESLKLRSQNKVYSITELETYAKCPFRYFVKYSLNIEEPETIDFSISPLEIGSLLHNVLYKFYKELQSNQTLRSEDQSIYQDIIQFLKNIGYYDIPVILDTDQKIYYLSVLSKITKEQLKKIKFEHPFYDLEIENILGFQNKPGYLEMWLNAEIDKQQKNWRFIPALFELSFGITTQDHFGPVHIDNHFKLKGKIDRIEFAIIDNNLYFIIADYKSNLNNIASQKDILDGVSFQMPLYLVATKNLFEITGKTINPFGAVYYNLKPNSKNGTIEFFKCLMIPPSNPIKSLLGKSISQTLKSDDELNDVLNKSIEHAKKIVDNVNNFHFPVNPLNLHVCKNCNYISACRIKEKKIILDISESEE